MQRLQDTGDADEGNLQHHEKHHPGVLRDGHPRHGYALDAFFAAEYAPAPATWGTKIISVLHNQLPAH